MNVLPETVQILVTAIAGSAVGTLVKAVYRPEPHFGRWLVQLLASFCVGGMVGAALIEYFHLATFTGSAAAGVCAVIAEDIVRGIQARGRKIREGKVDLSLRGDDSDDR